MGGRVSPASSSARLAIATLVAVLLCGYAALAVAGSSSSSPSPSVASAIELAGATYGYEAALWRKARCETGGTFSPTARNRSSGALGLFQFLASTWRSTPYARFSRTDPYASALAAGWMHAHGRGAEWVCQ